MHHRQRTVECQKSHWGQSLQTAASARDIQSDVQRARQRRISKGWRVRLGARSIISPCAARGGRVCGRKNLSVYRQLPRCVAQGARDYRGSAPCVPHFPSPRAAAAAQRGECRVRGGVHVLPASAGTFFCFWWYGMWQASLPHRVATGRANVFFPGQNAAQFAAHFFNDIANIFRSQRRAPRAGG